MKNLYYTLALIGFIFNQFANAQPGSIDLSFDPGTGFSGGGVNVIALQTDGKVVAGGFCHDTVFGNRDFVLIRVWP